MGFDEAAKLWIEGYINKRYVLIPNQEVSGPYADMLDPERKEERNLFAKLSSELGWADSLGESRTYGSRAPRPSVDARELAPPANLSAVQPSSSSMKCSGKAEAVC